jgi:hypothetical protein
MPSAAETAFELIRLAEEDPRAGLAQEKMLRAANPT